MPNPRCQPVRLPGMRRNDQRSAPAPQFRAAGEQIQRIGIQQQRAGEIQQPLQHFRQSGPVAPAGTGSDGGTRLQPRRQLPHRLRRETSLPPGRKLAEDQRCRQRQPRRNRHRQPDHAGSGAQRGIRRQHRRSRIFPASRRDQQTPPQVLVNVESEARQLAPRVGGEERLAVPDAGFNGIQADVDQPEPSGTARPIPVEKSPLRITESDRQRRFDRRAGIGQRRCRR